MGESYGDMDWEDIVEDVCIRGLPEVLWDVAGCWRAQFTRMRTIAQSLRDGKGDIGQAWDSPAGRVYVQHLENIAGMFDKAEEALKPAASLCESAADSLNQTMIRMPIPNNSVDEVAEAHKDWLQKGYVIDSHGRCVSMIGQDSGGRMILPGYFREVEQRNWLSSFGNEFAGWFSDFWSETFGDAEEKAQQQIQSLNNSYSATAAHTEVTNPGTVNTLNDSPLGPNAFNASGADHGVGGLGSGGMPHTGTGGLGAGTGLSGLDTGGLGGQDPGTGLAGAGGGLTGAGGLGGGLGGLGGGGLGGGAGAGLGSGAGIGGLGAGGLGAGLKPVSAIGMPAGVLPAPGSSGRSAGRGMAGAGMMGAGGHGAHGGQTGEHASWLTEDEDIWGGDTDLGPSVLGR